MTKRYAVLGIIIALVISIAAIGCSSGTNKQSSDTELQGTWMGTETETDGIITHTFIFSGNHWALTGTSTSPSVSSAQGSGTFTLDSTANPKTIDLHFSDAEMVGKPWLCLYQLSDTNLTLAVGREPGDARPTSFTDENTVILVKQ